MIFTPTLFAPLLPPGCHVQASSLLVPISWWKEANKWPKNVGIIN